MLNWLPFSTTHDKSEEPAGSVDPLGTLSEAERLAEVLLPGLTGRMWSPRLLTYSAVAAEISDTVARLAGEEHRLEARLIFERLFVYGIVRSCSYAPDKYNGADWRLPGRRLAKRALDSNESLQPSNFLKGQAANGPYGVMARLSRATGITDEEGRLGPHGADLLSDWAAAHGLKCFLEDVEQAEEETGAKWKELTTKSIRNMISKRGTWPGDFNEISETISESLRPDRIPAKEKKFLLNRLGDDPIRGPVLNFLRTPAAVAEYCRTVNDGRPGLERAVLSLMLQGTNKSDNPANKVIAGCAKSIIAYESASRMLQDIFYSVVWGIKQILVNATKESVLDLPPVRRTIEHALADKSRISNSLKICIEELRNLTFEDAANCANALELLRDDISACGESPQEALDAVLRRHERTQRGKRKGPWIDSNGSVLQLMPGYGTDTIPSYSKNIFVHPIRIVNAFSLLRVLGVEGIAKPGEKYEEE